MTPKEVAMLRTAITKVRINKKRFALVSSATHLCSAMVPLQLFGPPLKARTSEFKFTSVAPFKASKSSGVTNIPAA